MIRIRKSINTPAILTTKGVSETAENCRLYDGNPTGYDSGKHKLIIEPGIYGHQLVKEQLIADQYGKCCFCESDFTANGYGDVEHFRPKMGFSKTPNSRLIRPGYYWLAYDWSNLFFSCQICNQRFKKNYFPLEDEAARAKNHTFDYRNEANLLIHPSQDEPTDHITFNRHVPVAKTSRGKSSIIGFGIDRPELNKIRERHYQLIHLSKSYVGIDLAAITLEDKEKLSHQFKVPWVSLEQTIITAQNIASKAVNKNEPFSAMVRANFPDLL